MERESILNDIPNGAAAIALLIAGVEILMQAAGAGIIGGQMGIGWRNDMISDFAFFPAVQDEIINRGFLPAQYLWRYFTYPFIHDGLTHAFFALALVLALGKFIGDRWHWASLFAVFVIPGAAAAFVFGLIAPQNWPLYGAYPPVYGLVGAFTYMLWMRLGETGGNQWRAFAMIGMLVLVQILWGLMMKIFALLGMGGDPTPFVFFMGVGDLAGFATGLALSPIVGPGSWRAFVARLRQR